MAWYSRFLRNVTAVWTNVDQGLTDPSRRRFISFAVSSVCAASFLQAWRGLSRDTVAYEQAAYRLTRTEETPAPVLPDMPPLPRPRVARAGEVRDLLLYNTNTHESARLTFFANGAYNPQALQQLNILLRDHHGNIAHVMDPKLLTLVHDMQKVFNDRPVHILSAYRTQATQNDLIRQGATRARDSFHVKGRAVDLRFPGVPVSALRDVAKILGVGGVGYYPWARFVHVDTGPVRYW